MYMDRFELRQSFEQTKTRLLEKLEKTKARWEMLWKEAQGDPKTEAELVHVKLDIQIMEANMFEEFARMEKKINEAEEDGMLA